ncbi:MAG: hypothetical protein ACRELX_14380, partial [Longimicrobiales bacterium]
MKRILVLGVLFAAVMLALTVVDAPVTPAAATPAVQSPVPPEALDAIENGRYLHASLILREYLATLSDTTHGTILLTAEAEAGWGDWERVELLLAGRPWLDSLASGFGWSLLGRSQLELGRYEEAGSSLSRYLEVSDGAGDRERGLAATRAADGYRELERYTAAIEAYDLAAALLPRIADWLGYEATGAAAAMGDTAETRRRMAELPADLASGWAWQLPIRAYREASDLADAETLAETVAEGNGSAARRAEAWSLIGELRLLRGDTG